MWIHLVKILSTLYAWETMGPRTSLTGPTTRNEAVFLSREEKTTNMPNHSKCKKWPLNSSGWQTADIFKGYCCKLDRDTSPGVIFSCRYWSWDKQMVCQQVATWSEEGTQLNEQGKFRYIQVVAVTHCIVLAWTAGHIVEDNQTVHSLHSCGQMINSGLQVTVCSGNYKKK